MEEPPNHELQYLLRKKRNKKRGVVATVVLLTIALHVIVGLIAGTIYIVHEIVEEAEDFEEPPPIAIESAPPPPPPTVTKMKAKSSPPRPRPIVVHNPNNISLPALDVPNIDTNISISGRGSGGFGVGVGGGSGGAQNFKIDASFFGTKGGGEHIAFIVDYSGSMGAGDRNEVMRRELVKSIESLPDGAKVAVICFSGPAWDIYDDITVHGKNWVHFGEGASDFYPKSQKAMSKAKWIELKSGSKKNLIKRIRETPLIYGTQFDTAFYLALKLDPLPETIFFMTDGSCGKERGIEPIERMINQIKRKHGAKAIPIINAVGLEVGGAQNYYDMTNAQQREWMKEREDKIKQKKDKEKQEEERQKLEEDLAKMKKNHERNKKSGKSQEEAENDQLNAIAKLGNGQTVYINGWEYLEENGDDKQWKSEWYNKAQSWDEVPSKQKQSWLKEEKVYSAFDLLKVQGE